MKKFICGLLAGVIISGAGVYAVNEIYDNPYPILVNGEQKQIQGYNIDGYSYFKLRDIADVVGGFTVDFNNDTIQLSKDGYVYENSNTIDYSKYLGTYSKLGGSLGYNWILTINSIDENGVDFNFNYEKLGFVYTNDPAVFVNEKQAVANGKIIHEPTQNTTESHFILDFMDNGINCTESDDAGERTIFFSFDDKQAS